MGMLKHVSIRSWASARTHLGYVAAALGTVLCASFAATTASAESDSSETRAAAFIGGGESSTIALIRELSEWRARAIEAEALLAKSGIRTAEAARANLGGSARVLSSLEGERLVILSIGRSSGALQGAMLSLGDGVVAKVVESRETVAAALVDRSYKGKLANLEGLPVQLAVR